MKYHIRRANENDILVITRLNRQYFHERGRNWLAMINDS